MDAIEFRATQNHIEVSGARYTAALIFINGKNLIDLLRHYERPFADREGKPELAGQYLGLPVQELYENLTENVPGKKATVLGCICGDVDDWPLDVLIRDAADTITWSEFENWQRNGEDKNTGEVDRAHADYWDYSSFGPFKFDKAQYSEQLALLKQMAQQATV